MQPNAAHPNPTVSASFTFKDRSQHSAQVAPAQRAPTPTRCEAALNAVSMRRTTGAVCAAALAAAAAVWLLRRRRRVRHTAAQPHHVVVRRVRHCVPYEATSTHVVKDRHAGVPASAMLQANLGADAAFWSGEIAAGRVTLPRGRAAGDALLPGDTLQVTRHIHEQAVIATEAPRVLYEDDGLLVVDKPAGVPTQDDSPGIV